MARATKELKVDAEKREHMKRIGFQKGKSGNPKGRPPEDAALKEQIRRKLPELIDRLEEIAFDGKNESSAVKAIETMLAYVLPKAAQETRIDMNVNVGVAELFARAAERVTVIEATPDDVSVIHSDSEDTFRH